MPSKLVFDWRPNSLGLWVRDSNDQLRAAGTEDPTYGGIGYDEISIGAAVITYAHATHQRKYDFICEYEYKINSLPILRRILYFPVQPGDVVDVGVLWNAEHLDTVYQLVPAELNEYQAALDDAVEYAKLLLFIPHSGYSLLTQKVYALRFDHIFDKMSSLESLIANHETQITVLHSKLENAIPTTSNSAAEASQNHEENMHELQIQELNLKLQSALDAIATLQETMTPAGKQDTARTTTAYMNTEYWYPYMQTKLRNFLTATRSSWGRVKDKTLIIPAHAWQYSSAISNNIINIGQGIASATGSTLFYAYTSSAARLRAVKQATTSKCRTSILNTIQAFTDLLHSRIAGKISTMIDLLIISLLIIVIAEKLEMHRLETIESLNDLFTPGYAATCTTLAASHLLYYMHTQPQKDTIIRTQEVQTPTHHKRHKSVKM